ncbi:MAG TPA: phosphatidate cytidylyltransferase [Casimicrobiaceae bacterium]|nr:phosphatidate cytidylyltransferase [Casimicrobiaceae bacterium]
MLGARILTAVILVPLVLAALFLLAPVGWGTVSLAVVGIAASEWASLAGYARGAQTLFVAATIAIGAAVLALLATGNEARWADVVLLACSTATAFWVIVAPPWLAFRWKPSSGVALAIVGWIALTGAWVALVALQARSPWLVLAAMAIVWIADTAAYFAGRAFGRHKLAPQVSPGKTWEGVYGALAAVAIYALALTPFSAAAGRSAATTPLAVAIWVACALALAALSVEGDLFESLLKRNANVKDSGRLLPGHGGVLDRIDALLAAMPAAALLAQFSLR